MCAECRRFRRLLGPGFGKNYQYFGSEYKAMNGLEGSNIEKYSFYSEYIYLDKTSGQFDRIHDLNVVE